MLKFFNRKPYIKNIKLETKGWNLRESDSEKIIWDNELYDVMSLNYFEITPDIPVSVTDLNGIRNFYRQQIVAVGGGVIRIEVIDIRGLTAIECLFKIPMEPSGMSYVGSLTFPFRDRSFVVKTQSVEEGITGQRDAAVYASVIDFDELDEKDEEDFFKGWAKDPYDSSFTDGILMNLSEDEKYDENFPNHPLTKVRVQMKKIKSTITYDKKLFELESF